MTHNHKTSSLRIFHDYINVRAENNSFGKSLTESNSTYTSWRSHNRHHHHKPRNHQTAITDSLKHMKIIWNRRNCPSSSDKNRDASYRLTSFLFISIKRKLVRENRWLFIDEWIFFLKKTLCVLVSSCISPATSHSEFLSPFSVLPPVLSLSTITCQRITQDFYYRLAIQEHRWWDETARSLISHDLESKIIPNLPIWWKCLELKGIMVNKSRIHREIRNFLMYSSKLIKSDDELMIEIGENGKLWKIIQIDSTESRIIEFGLDFVEKSKIEVERKFRTNKSRFW